MNGVSKDQLVTSLARISCRICGYLGSRCDCKYMEGGEDFYHRDSEQTGCPETAMAATLINAMTPEEFHTIAQRAGIRILMNEIESVELEGIIKEMRKQRVVLIDKTLKGCK